ncbi:hypothetical protein [Caenimonas aquaedulcis]|uniref:Uncharacterized protein n=1 Tax=Caenimonas aquaedulcis TaxID=2793270 RepID=A0A931H7K0_9BURK|nr:hypothetical protein [Caenimonas aquaedulcis]MBG9389872.1 hypothetical protein [Caenimonas aquaedulcis]
MARTTRYRFSTGMFWVSVGLYVASLATTAYVTVEGASSQDHFGAEALVLGPIGFFAGHFSWLANPLLWGSWFTRTRQGISPSFPLALIAFIPAILFLVGETVPVGSAGSYKYHVSLGYYLWLSSMAVAAIAGFAYPATSEPFAQNAS